MIGKSYNRHPVTTEFARKFIADNSFWVLVLYYVGLLIVLSFVLAFVPYALISSVGYFDAFIYSSFGLLGESVDILKEDLSSWFYFYKITLKFLSILLPTAFLGLIVYKLFIIPDIFVFRQKLSVYEKERGKQYLAIRFYNGTNLDLSPVEIKIFARVPKQRLSGETFIKNTEIYANTWPISLPKVPFTINIPLNDKDEEKGIFSLDYESNEVILEEGNKLLILINGAVSELDKIFSEKHMITLDNIVYSKFTDIEVDYDNSPKNWKGWQDFDN